MDGAVFDRLADLMARMAAGDRGATFLLAHEFGGPIGAAVRREAARRGVDHVDRAEVDGLVIDVCVALDEIAGSWRPDGGALPWVWARHHVGRVVDRWLGQHADELTEVVLDRVERAHAAGPALGGAGDDLLDDAIGLLEAIARRDRSCALLREALDASGTTRRDQRLLLEMCLQRSLGDRSPAVTVGAMYGLSTDSVRQQVKRARDRVRRLAAAEPRYAPLADLPVLAA
jgi:hypothetical protein